MWGLNYMFQRILDNSLLIVAVVSVAVLVATIISQGEIRRFSYNKISDEVSSVFKINENMLKEFKFPKISTQIFSPLVIQQPKIEPPKIVAPPPVIKEPPRDPYEKYKNELKGYTGLGLMNQDGHTKVLLSKGDEMFILGVGDKITDKLIIREITDSSVVVGLIDDVQFRETIKINK